MYPRVGTHGERPQALSTTKYEALECHTGRGGHEAPSKRLWCRSHCSHRCSHLVARYQLAFFGASEMVIELAEGDNNGGTLQDLSANALHMNVREHKVGETQRNLARPFGAVRLPKYLVP